MSSLADATWRPRSVRATGNAGCDQRARTAAAEEFRGAARARATEWGAYMLRRGTPRPPRGGARLRGRRLAYPTKDSPPCPPTSGRRTRLDETLRREPP